MISVIIPVYNGEKVIKRCLDSIVSQSYKDIEIIVVDDGSVDGTEEAVKNFGGDKIKYIKQQNRGQGIARNTGISAASGEFLAFVDADDTICDDMLECMEKAISESGADVVQCGINDIRGGKAAPRAVNLNKTVSVGDREEYARVYFRGLYHTNEVCNKLIRRDFLISSGLKFDDTKEVFSEDFLFNINMLSGINKITFIDKPLYNYYISESGHCLKGSGERLEKICRLFRKAIENSCDEVIPSIKCVAAEVIMEYCASTEDKNIVRKVLCSDDVKEYFRTSSEYYCSKKHSLLMRAMLMLPLSLKIKVINLHIAIRKSKAD